MQTYTLEQSKKIYQDAKAKGLDGKKVIYLMAKQGATFDGLDNNGILDYGQKTYEPKPTLGQDIKTAFGERGKNIEEIQSLRGEGKTALGEAVSMTGEAVSKFAPKIGEAVSTAGGKIDEFTSKHPTLTKIFRNAPTGQLIDIPVAGQVAGGVQDVIGETISAVAPEKWKEWGTEKARQVADTALAQAGIDTIEKYNAWAEKYPLAAKNIEGVVNIGLTAGDIVGAGEAVSATTQGLKTAGKQVAGELTNISTLAKKSVGDVVKDAPEALAKFVAPDVDPKFATALKRTTKAEVDAMETVVKNAVENADNPSAFEVVGNRLADSTEQIDGQVKSLVQQKKSIISKAKNGLTDFTKETGNTILEINRSLKDSKLAKSFISRLKKVKNKIDADNAIDELQDILYKGNKDLTIPVGSKEDRVLKGIIGKYNSTLKDGLPASYRKINETISNKLNNLELLNKSLGETVEGVPIRGASLIKQYFSPSGTKAKELFEFIQKNTGYDVSKDAVLAKYLSEIYGETRAKSLLQGLPTTAQGTLDKLLDFTLQKTGVAGKVSELSRKGQVLKAKSIAK